MLLMLGQGGSLPDQQQRRERLRERQPHAGRELGRHDPDRRGDRRAHVAATSRGRRASGLVAPPASLTLLKIAGIAVAGVVLVLICNTNRGRLIPIKGVPWVVLIVLGVLAAWTFLLGRTKFGRYVYAIGGNPEAARRAGINLATDPHALLRARVVHRGDRRDRVRLPVAIGLDRARRRHARALRRRGRGDRWNEPVRRPGQADPRGARAAS